MRAPLTAVPEFFCPKISSIGLSISVFFLKKVRFRMGANKAKCSIICKSSNWAQSIINQFVFCKSWTKRLWLACFKIITKLYLGWKFEVFHGTSRPVYNDGHPRSAVMQPQALSNQFRMFHKIFSSILAYPWSKKILVMLILTNWNKVSKYIKLGFHYC